MSTRMATDISIGGKIATALVPELCRAIGEEYVALDWGDASFQPSDASELLAARQALEPGGALVLRLYHEQAHWGRFDDLEAFLQEHSIPYTRRSDGDCQYDPEVVEFRPGHALFELKADKDGEPIVEAGRLTAVAAGLDLAAAAESREAMLQQIEAVQRLLVDILPSSVPPLESLEIVTE